jgi:hypothetical protein
VMATELMSRYTEQLTTTVKTIERRRQTLCADVVRQCNWKRVEQLVEKTRDLVEPMFYDLKDCIVKSTVDESPVELTQDKYNTLVETYLGTAVHLVAFACGQALGAFVLQSLLSLVFSSWADLLLIVLLPIYWHLRLRKNRDFDEVDQRTALFGLATALGLCVGHLLGHKIAVVVPGAAFLQPLATGLLVGPLSAHFSSKRRLFVGVSAGVGAVLLLLTAWVTQQLSVGFVLTAMATTALYAAILQQTLLALHHGSFFFIDTQLIHLIAIVFMQTVFAAVFGTAVFLTVDV